MALAGKLVNRIGNPFESTNLAHPSVLRPGEPMPEVTIPGVGAAAFSSSSSSSPLSRGSPSSPSRRLSPTKSIFPTIEETGFLCKGMGYGGAASSIHRLLSPAASGRSSPVMASTTAAAGAGSPSSFAGFNVFAASGSPSTLTGGTAATTVGGGAGSPSGRGSPSAAPGSSRRSLSPVKAPRTNPKNTLLRTQVERGGLEFPCILDMRDGAPRKLLWRTPLSKVDYTKYLPVFFDGLREEEMPFSLIAKLGVKDLLTGGEGRVLPLIPAVVPPLRAALSTRRLPVMLNALQALKDLVLLGGPGVGRALIPFYRQLLGCMSIFFSQHKNLGDGIDYSQRFGTDIASKIEEVLHVLEAHGGPDALVNIKYLIPTYESGK